jgi:hypothetical protein
MTKTAVREAITRDHENSNNRRSGAITAFWDSDRSRKRSRRSRKMETLRSSDHATDHAGYTATDHVFPPLFRRGGNVTVGTELSCSDISLSGNTRSVRLAPATQVSSR